MRGLEQQCLLGGRHSSRAQPGPHTQRSSHRQHRQRHISTQANGNTFGHSFRVTTFGESHGKGVGCVIDGVPPRLPITKEEIQVSAVLYFYMQQRALHLGCTITVKLVDTACSCADPCSL